MHVLVKIAFQPGLVQNIPRHRVDKTVDCITKTLSCYSASITTPLSQDIPPEQFEMGIIDLELKGGAECRRVECRSGYRNSATKHCLHLPLTCCQVSAQYFSQFRRKLMLQGKMFFLGLYTNDSGPHNNTIRKANIRQKPG